MKITFKIAFIAGLTLLATSLWAQAEPAAEPAAFPLLLLVPYGLGVLAHWVKKYQLDGAGIPLFPWLFTNFAWTIGSLIGGLSAVYGIFALNPAAMVGGNPGSWLQVFLVAMAADGFNQSSKTTPVP